MTSATSSTSILRVHSSPARHSVPPRSHSRRDTQIADTPLSQLARNFEVFTEVTTDTIEKLAAHNKAIVKMLHEVDERIKELAERVRRLENLVGGNIVREGYN